MLCEYGCGNEAKYFLKRAKKWCCSKSYNSCPVARRKNKEKHLGENNHRFGKTCSEETKRKISEANTGNEPWNKNKINVYTEDTIEKMSEARKGSVPWNKGKIGFLTHSEETKQKLRELNTGKFHTLETRQKTSKGKKGKKYSKQSRELMSKNSSDKSNQKNPNWKGGYSKRNVPLYDTFAKQLTIEEKPERDGFDSNILTVVCTQCKKRFIPSLTSVAERVRCLKGTQSGECRLYCSDNCKSKCSIFNKILYSNNETKIINYTQEEYNTFRMYVLERDKYICQYCGDQASEVHHERPQKLEPFFSLDPDFAWSCCEKCHYEKGHKDECSTGNLAKRLC